MRREGGRAKMEGRIARGDSIEAMVRWKISLGRENHMLRKVKAEVRLVFLDPGCKSTGAAGACESLRRGLTSKWA